MKGISVIIPFKNAAEHLPSLLEALMVQRRPADEIILVDNNSSDRSVQIAKDFISAQVHLPIKLLSQKKPGASAARNFGAASAQSDWLVFTDADCIPDPAWLEDLSAAVEKGPEEIAACAGRINPAPPRNITARFLGLYTLPANKKDQVYSRFSFTRGGGFPTANFAVRREVFERVGGFDESIRIYGEDHDLCLKIYQTGYKIKALKSAVILHDHRAAFKGLCKQSYGFGRSHAVMLKRVKPALCVFHVPGIRAELKIGLRCWLDFNQADKKLALSVIPGLFWWPLFALPVLFFLYLNISVWRKGRKLNQKAGILELPALSFLLLVKSASMTLGRILYSLRYGVICF